MPDKQLKQSFWAFKSVAFCRVKWSCFEVEFSVKHRLRLYQQTGWLACRGLAQKETSLAKRELAGYTPIFCYCRRIERLSKRLVIT